MSQRPSPVLCTLTPDLAQRLAAGETVLRAVWMDGSVAMIRICADEARPLTQIGPFWVVAEVAEQVRAALVAAGHLATDEPSDALL